MRLELLQYKACGLQDLLARLASHLILLRLVRREAAGGFGNVGDCVGSSIFLFHAIGSVHQPVCGRELR